MSVSGGIDFLSPPGGKVDWNYDLFLPPALTRPIPQDQRISLPRRPADSVAEGDAITTTAFGFEATFQREGEQGLYLDRDTTYPAGEVKVVIVCTSQVQDMNKKEHHVLLVSEVISEVALTTALPTYERIGVGLLPETCLERKSGVKIVVG